jgi:hypothetical protein
LKASGRHRWCRTGVKQSQGVIPAQAGIQDY